MNRFRWVAMGLGMLCLALPTSLFAADTSARDVKALAARIDRLIEAGWGKEVKPAPLADDAEFFRRVHLDLAGRIPSITEVRDFLDDPRPDKRRLWVERILRADPADRSYRDAHVNHFATVWRDLLLSQTTQQARFQAPALEAWLQQRLKANVRYDQMVRELLTAQSPGNQGFVQYEASPAVYFQANENKPENVAGSVARLFLGVKLECAQCHNHPFAEWKRTQFWEFAAFFSDLPQQPRLGRQPAPAPGRREIKVPNTDQVVKARFLDGKEPHWKDGVSSRVTLAEWVTAADNPFFARAAVNRLWGYLFGIGLNGQVDGPGDSNPASHPELLDELARQFVAHGYDPRFIIRAITASRAYQRTSSVSDPSHKELTLFTRMAVKGLTPEQLFDSLAVATEYKDDGITSQQPFFAQANQSPRATFLAKFAAQDRRTEYQTSILQALYLMNNSFVADRTSLQRNRTLATIAEQRTSTARKIETLYLVTLSRKPRPEESTRLVKYVESGGPTGDSRKAITDVFWALLNSSEFVLNH